MPTIPGTENLSPAVKYVIAFAIIFLLLALFALILRRLTGGRNSLSSERGRARQPRLGIVDVYDLDRQRQLILLRRDNVEHLLLVGGPNDVVVETNIVRVPGARLPAAQAAEMVENGEAKAARNGDGAQARPVVGGTFGPADILSSPAPETAALEPVLKPTRVQPAPSAPAPARSSAGRPAAKPSGPDERDAAVPDMARELEATLRQAQPPQPFPPAQPAQQRAPAPATPPSPPPAIPAPQGPLRPAEPPRSAAPAPRPAPQPRPEPPRQEPPRQEPPSRQEQQPRQEQPQRRDPPGQPAARPEPAPRQEQPAQPPRPVPATPARPPAATPPRQEPPRQEPPQAPRQEASRQEPPRQEPHRQEAPRQEAPQAPRQDPPRQPTPPAGKPETPAAASAAKPDPFSIEDIEAEFARLLGRPLDKKD